jgi:glycosyltransferase involved in cell wall biosynthesis
MTAFNAEKWIAEAIQSILAQTMPEFEIIIINDGSTDETDTVIRSFHDERIRYIHCTQNKGISVRANQALLIAESELIARFDADDISAPDRLEKQINAFEKENELIVCSSWCRYIDEEGRPKEIFRRAKTEPVELFISLLKGENYTVNSAAMFRKDAMLTVGGYNEALSLSEDVDLLLRMVCRGGTIRVLPEVLLSIRSAESSITKQRREIVEKTFNDVMKNFYRMLGLSDLIELNLFTSFFNNEERFIASLNEQKVKLFFVTVRNMAEAISRIKPLGGHYKQRFLGEISSKIKKVYTNLQTFVRLKESLSNPEFAKRLSPERRIQIEEIAAAAEVLNTGDIEAAIFNATRAVEIS